MYTDCMFVDVFWVFSSYRLGSDTFLQVFAVCLSRVNLCSFKALASAVLVYLACTCHLLCNLCCLRALFPQFFLSVTFLSYM